LFPTDGASPAAPRLLIADDVGIGKTIEAGLILRELMDRGEVDAFSVLCPPHLVEQWLGELKARFGIDAVPVTSSTASRLERGLPLAQTLFEPIPSRSSASTTSRLRNAARVSRAPARTSSSSMKPMPAWERTRASSSASIFCKAWLGIRIAG
jgi:SNF2 family DNA or RNA helicase